MMLTQQAFHRVRRYVEAHGRPLEIARLHFHFDGAPASEVISELVKFQNADGGFGNALEPDLRAPGSSALATSVAFQILREIDASGPPAMISGAVAYLLRTCSREKLTWRIIPESAEAFPHAPWWSQAGREERLDRFELNPTAELLGYLYDHRERVPPDLIAALTDKVVAHLSSLTEIEMHDFLCCKRLAETAVLEDSSRTTILRDLKRLLGTTVSTGPSQWAQYGLRPIQVADRPDSPFFEPLRDAVAENLDYEAATLQDDGSWPVTWSWGDSYPQVSLQATSEWTGVFAIEKALALKRYGRIEGWVRASEER